MRLILLVAMATVSAGVLPAAALDQASAVGPQRKVAARPTPPPPAPVQKVAAQMVCPSPLGIGVSTKVSFCDVMTESKPASGIVVTLPPHTGPVTLTFNLHNRHTYSEEQTRANRAYARYTASIGVFTVDNTLISRAVVQSEFRNASDLLDRIAGGAGPGGVKAVAPTGTESISIEIPEGADQVSILGEKVTNERLDGTSETYASAGRPVAVVSTVRVEFHPPPPPKPTAARRKRR